MKLSVLLLFAAAVSVIAQSAVASSQAINDRVSQADCPVVLTSASLTPYLMLLRASTAPPSEGGLDLHFRNASGKEIRAMEFDAEFLAKKSIYDLSGVKVDLHLTASGTQSIDNTFEQLRHLPLPARTNPVLLDRITLEQVTFMDGSVWTAKSGSFCGVEPNGVQQIAK